MRRTATAVALLAALLMGVIQAPLASAGSPHFLRAGASGPDAGGRLAVSFKEAGLGNNQLITYNASADVTVVYACRNNGGQWPQDPKKQQLSGPVSTTGTFSSGKNGTISQTLTINPPPATLVCPGGQHRVRVSVVYTNVRITDTTNGVFKGIPGTFSRIFYTLR